MKPYPLTFHPILKQTVWGGRNLVDLGKDLPEGARVGESWEIADVTAEAGIGQSVIASGPLTGTTLRDAIASHIELILGRRLSAVGHRPSALMHQPRVESRELAADSQQPKADSFFPLLIKYLDAHENLSVQVHPSEAYAAAHHDALIKHEAWVILRAEPESVIYLGLKRGVTRERFRAGIADRDVVSLLNAVPVTPGQCFHIPSGTVHALGAGITLAEVQTSSDCTFRIYDWGREDTPDARQMHIEQAMQCIDFNAGPLGPAAASLLPPIAVGALHTQPLADTPHFGIERIDALDNAAIDIVTSDMPEVWMMLSGRGQIRTGKQPILDIERGMTLLMPAALCESEPASAVVQRGTSILRITLPSPVKGMIA